MSIHIERALGIHPEALELRSERMKILASNLANESTPGYQARDIDFAASLQRALSVQQAPAGGGELSPEQTQPQVLYRVPNLPSQDGNTVELGVEQAAFSQNASDFQASMTFINLQLRELTKAIQGQ